MGKDVITLHQDDEIVQLLYNNNFAGLVSYLEEHPEFDVNAQYLLPDAEGNLFTLVLMLCYDEDDNQDILAELLDYADELGLNVNDKDSEGYDALHYAILNGWFKASKLLLQSNKFDMNQKHFDTLLRKNITLFDLALDSFWDREALELTSLMVKLGYKPTREDKKKLRDFTHALDDEEYED